MTNDNNFALTKESSRARAGELITRHGAVPTPVFMPVGSQGTVKTLTPDELHDIGFKMVLANTYHLYLRPGIPTIKELGGLHSFMGWDGAILTDSGGYQVFSLSGLRRVTDDGVTFRSHIDGGRHFISPEKAIELQETLGADIIMAFDECPPIDATPAVVEQAMRRTHRWAERCLKIHQDSSQQLFAIVQGGLDPGLRRTSADYLVSLGFPGYAIGGLSLGEPKAVTFNIVEQTAACLPPEKPRYLMGVGSPEDIVEGVARGIDIFDSALPTRVARNGGLYTGSGRFNITNSSFKNAASPIETACGCYTCRHFSAAYLHHLFNARELLAYRLATIHNLFFMKDLMRRTRQSIIDNAFDEFKNGFLAGYRAVDEEIRLSQKKKWLERRSKPGG